VFQSCLQNVLSRRLGPTDAVDTGLRLSSIDQDEQPAPTPTKVKCVGHFGLCKWDKEDENDDEWEQEDENDDEVAATMSGASSSAHAALVFSHAATRTTPTATATMSGAGSSAHAATQTTLVGSAVITKSVFIGASRKISSVFFFYKRSAVITKED
jgi:hypothetical protein